MEDIGDISLHDLAVMENMTARAVAACIQEGLDTFRKIHYYNIKHGGFSRLRNVGRNTNSELITLCNKYEIKEMEAKIHSEVTGTEVPRIKIRPDLELRVLADLENLSAMYVHFCLDKDLTTLNRIMHYYFRLEKNWWKIHRNYGTRIVNELQHICNKYEFDYQHGIGYENSEDRLKAGWGKKMVTPADQFLRQLNTDRAVYHKIMDKLTGFEAVPLFQILNTLINHNCIFDTEFKKSFFKHAFKCYFTPSTSTLSAIARENNRSSTRVSQLSAGLVKKLGYYFPVSTMADFKDVFYEYIPDQTKQVLLISDEDAMKINEREGTDFTPLFITYILSYLYADKYRRLGKLYHLFLEKRNSTHKRVKHLYLINRVLVRHFDFDGLFYSLESLLLDRTVATISFEKIFEQFQKFHYEDRQAIVDVIGFIIAQEFDANIRIDSDELIIFQ